MLNTEQEVRQEFNRFFTRRSLASTYKPYFLKSLFDLTEYDDSTKQFHGKDWIEKLPNGLKVDLEFIASRFAFLYWNPHFKFKLKQSPHPREHVHVYLILDDLQNMLEERKKIPKITVFCSPMYSNIRKRIITKCIKPDVLHRLLKDCNIYRISNDKKSIFVPNTVIEFIHKNKPSLQNAIDFVITSFLETCNSAPQIATKISAKSPVPNLKKSIFDQMIRIQKGMCFYCEKRKITVQEHVIPKDYVWDTKPHNIVGACTECNREKWYNLLPDKDTFNKVLQRNDEEWLRRIEGDLYSREAYELQYNTCHIDYANEAYWSPKNH
jgi:5-methylcytosine-specific restriction endonuclease McrA